MQKCYTLLLLLCFLVSGASAQVLWENFEDTRKGTYGFINGSFIPYSQNPAPDATNSSLVAASYTRNAAETFDVLILDAPMADLTDYLSNTKQMSIAVWSPNAGTTVQITLENSTLAQPANFPTGRHSIFLATTTVASGWEVLTFSFDQQPDPGVGNNDVDRVVLLFAPNTNTGDTYYWDNFNGPELDSDPCDGVTPDPLTLEDFECNQNLKYTFSHSGINFRRVDNPDTNGNPSDKVATYTRNGGEEFDVIIGRFDGNLSVSENSEITMDVWDPNAPTTVRLSLQTVDGDVILAMDAATSTSNAWNTISFDPSAVSASTDIGQFVILFDPETFTADQYYFDNIVLNNSTAVNDLPQVSTFTVAPNPSPGYTVFQYELLQTADVDLSVYDLTGKKVATVLRERQAAGAQQAEWSADNLANGMYYYTLTVDGQVASGKIALNR